MPAQPLRKDSREIWFSRVEDWQRKGLTQAEYCRQQGLKPTSFYNWLAKYRQTQGHLDRPNHQENVNPNFIPVSIDAKVEALTLTVGEVSLRFSSQLPPAALIPWIKALRTV